MSVSFARKDSCRSAFVRRVQGSGLRGRSLVNLAVAILLCSFSALAQSSQAPNVSGAENRATAARGTGVVPAGQQAEQRLPGNISGMIVDRSGGVVAGAQVRLTRDDHSPNQDVLSGDDGQFSFTGIAPGPFYLRITSAGFATQTFSGSLEPGENYVVPQVALAVATAVSEVQVIAPTTEVAEVEIKEQEKQRVFGVIPNFYVSYIPNAAPLTPKQKFELAWKSSIDPVTFGMIGVIAGVQQAQNNFAGYGQGAEGYGKRYGASYGDFLTSTFIGGAILPSLLKQDPRYFYKGTGTKRSRVLYAIANSVICKGDNGHWQTNYSAIAGSLASGGISNAYYPSKDRGAALVFENALIGIGEAAATNILQEFLVKKLTPNLPNHNSSNP
jgi:Carboxypeptidase regulatory-like domain